MDDEYNAGIERGRELQRKQYERGEWAMLAIGILLGGAGALFVAFRVFA
jgi:hypothetical protein